MLPRRHKTCAKVYTPLLLTYRGCPSVWKDGTSHHIDTAGKGIEYAEEAGKASKSCARDSWTAVTQKNHSIRNQAYVNSWTGEFGH